MATAANSDSHAYYCLRIHDDRFLIAEIFSRYFADVHMHSFDNGTGVIKKRDNWRLLKKLFRKWDFNLPDDEEVMVEQILQAKSFAIVTFINAMYTFLTARQVAAVARSCRVARPVMLVERWASSLLCADHALCNFSRPCIVSSTPWFFLKFISPTLLKEAWSASKD